MAINWDRTAAAILAFANIVLLIVFFKNEVFFDWVFERHQNTLSWAVRPILLLPFCYAAWRHSLAGVMASILAILSSMFWFPVPTVPRADVLRFLEMEKDFLSQGLSVWSLAGGVAVVGYVWALAAAFWKRSWRMGLAIAATGALAKSLWGLLFSPEAGRSIIPFAVSGFALLVIAVLIEHRINKGR